MEFIGSPDSFEASVGTLLQDIIVFFFVSPCSPAGSKHRMAVKEEREVGRHFLI
jgi:hypothetical protein